jgi:sulfite reductase (NADPH) flavoprotein alpha-component
MTIPIYFATVTGNSRDLAERAERRLKALGFEAEARDLVSESAESLREGRIALFIVSTWGDGEPPDDAIDYVARLQSDEPLGLGNLQYSVCALGDSGYEIFCGCGKIIDARLEHHGATRLVPRADCDVDFEELFATWFEAVTHAISTGAPAPQFTANL